MGATYSRAENSPLITKGERYREILATLARHGIGIIDDELIKHEAGDRARAEHLRRACEELGTMFIKLGQVLSTRSDLLPKYIAPSSSSSRMMSRRCPRMLSPASFTKT